MSKLIVKAITEHYGERCPDYDEDCFCCKVWSEYDALTSPARCDELVTVARVTTVFKGIETFAGDFIRGKLKSGDILVTRQNAEEVIAAERMKLEATAKVGLQLSEQIEALEADNKRLREALEAMLIPFEDSNCRHDHHGYCQEHFLEEDCCVAKARAALGEVKP